MKTCEGCIFWKVKRMFLGPRPWCHLRKRVWSEWCADYKGRSK